MTSCMTENRFNTATAAFSSCGFSWNSSDKQNHSMISDTVLSVSVFVSVLVAMITVSVILSLIRLSILAVVIWNVVIAVLLIGQKQNSGNLKAVAKR